MTGSVVGGMFGLAVASLGDIDLDGFEGIAAVLSHQCVSVGTCITPALPLHPVAVNT